MTGRRRSSSKGSAPTGEAEAAGGVELDIGGLFRGLGDIVQLVTKLAEAGEQHISREREFRVKGLGDQARGIYGFSIRSGIGGVRPKVEPFGNVRAGADGLEVGDIREPLVDVFDEGEEVVVTAELPGVAERDISVTFEHDKMRIETLGARHFVKEVDLPSALEPGTLKQTYNNGVLELRTDKRK